MTVNNDKTPKPVKPTPAKPNPVKPIKVQSSQDKNAPDLINRKLVASALDRPGKDGTAPDGVVSDDEFSKAGIKVDQDAKDAINQYGEQGDKITVNELSQALSNNQVSITGDGNVSVVDGYAQLTNGRLQRSSAWNFPDIPGLRTLEEVVRLAPNSYYDPSDPGSEFTHTEKSRTNWGHSNVIDSHSYMGDSFGNEVSKDANGNYPPNSETWYRLTIADYDELRSALLQKARSIQSITYDSNDQELRTIHDQVSRAVSDVSWGGSDESDCRRLYDTLHNYDGISLPEWPQDRMNNIDEWLNKANASLNDHFRILQQVPVEKAKDVVQQEVDRLHTPTAPAKMVSSGLGAVLAGGLGFAGLSGLIGGTAVLAGLPLIGAAVGIGVAGLGLGWLVGKLIDDHRAGTLQNDLKVLQTISPQANQQLLQQYAMSGYKLLQDARGVYTLARVRAYDEQARPVQDGIVDTTNRLNDEAASLRDLKSLVDKYAKK